MTAASRRPSARRVRAVFGRTVGAILATASAMVSAGAHAADALVLSTASAASSVAASPATGGSTAAGSAISAGGSLAQAGLGLFGVIALILAIAWIARRTGLVRHVSGGAMKVVASLSLGARQRLLMVEVGDTWIVLGVSAGEIRPLHTMPADRSLAGQPSPYPGAQPSQTPGTFAERLLRSMQENLKKS